MLTPRHSTSTQASPAVSSLLSGRQSQTPFHTQVHRLCALPAFVHTVSVITVHAGRPCKTMSPWFREAPAVHGPPLSVSPAPLSLCCSCLCSSPFTFMVPLGHSSIGALWLISGAQLEPPACYIRRGLLVPIPPSPPACTAAKGPDMPRHASSSR